MAILSSLSADEVHHFHVAMTASMQVRNHFDVLSWLQGDLQVFLPHDILIASWGNFQQGDIQHDVLSRLPGARSNDANDQLITPLMLGLYARWSQFGCEPLSLNVREPGVLGCDDAQLPTRWVRRCARCAVPWCTASPTSAATTTACMSVFLPAPAYGATERKLMAVVMPYIDTALRQVAHLPHQSRQDKRDRRASDLASAANVANAAAHLPGTHAQKFGLTERESEVLHWVARGKTNPGDRDHPRHQRVHGQEPHAKRIPQARREQPCTGRQQIPSVFLQCPNSDAALSAATLIKRPLPAPLSRDNILGTIESLLGPSALVFSLWAIRAVLLRRRAAAAGADPVGAGVRPHLSRPDAPAIATPGRVVLDIAFNWVWVAGLVFAMGIATGYIRDFPSSMLLTWLWAAPSAELGLHLLLRMTGPAILRMQGPPQRAIIVGMNEQGHGAGPAHPRE